MQSRMMRMATMVASTVVLSAVLVELPTAAGATIQADPPSGGRRGGMRQPPSPAVELDRLAQAMQAAAVPLDDTQKTKILGVLEDRETAMRALRESGATGEGANTERDKLMVASRASIRAVLSEAQARVFDAMPSGAPGGGSGGRTASPSSAAQADSLIDANTGGDPQSAM